tara:strand:- start:1763 stop:2947 length:1185 start_codon:yes stop_codon:yes gene_type:complete
MDDNTDQDNSRTPIIPTIGGALRTNVLALAHLHMKANWHPAPVHSFTLPLWYRGTYDEQMTARTKSVIADRSYLGRFYVTGEDTEALLERIFATDPRRMSIGNIGPAIACNQDGTIFDIVAWAKLDSNRWVIITGPRTQTALLIALQAAVDPDSDIVIRDRIEESVLLHVSGPTAAKDLVSALGPTIPEAVPTGEAHEILLGGYRALVARYSDTGEDGYYLLTSPEVGEHIWQQMLSVGTEPIGLAASDALRLEANRLEAPTETPAPSTPAHAGLNYLVDFVASNGIKRDFIGSNSLRISDTSAGPERLLRALVLGDKGLAKKGDPLVNSSTEQPIAACVAGIYSSQGQVSIGFAYIPTNQLTEQLEIVTESGKSTVTIIAPERLLQVLKTRAN